MAAARKSPVRVLIAAILAGLCQFACSGRGRREESVVLKPLVGPPAILRSKPTRLGSPYGLTLR